MNPQRSPLRILAFIASAIAVVLLAALWLPPLNEWVRKGVSSELDDWVWDIWHGSTVTWNTRTITLPKGKYKWIKSEKDVLTIASRDPLQHFVVSLSAGREAAFDGKGYVSELCKRDKNCVSVNETSEQILDQRAEITEFTYLGGQAQFQAYMQLRGASVLAHIMGDSEPARREGMSLVRTIFGAT